MGKCMLVGLVLGVIVAGRARANGDLTLPPSVFDQQLQQIRSEYSVYSAQQPTGDNFSNQSQKTTSSPKHLSPGKAFVYSLVVPGLGQYYNGNKIKAAGFFLLDVTSWLLASKHHSNGNDLTADFEKFQQMYWARSRYRDFLIEAYKAGDDDSITNHTEISHHLPDTPTQQYYEMTGKYDQFAWGWDDANLNGRTLYLVDSAGDTIVNNVPQVSTSDSVPRSLHRDSYEQMRFDANHQFDLSDRWIIIALANHVISAFEALITANRKNSHNGGEEKFGRFDVKAELRTYVSYKDTPYVRLSYAF
jgi:hypothetical protein